MGNKGTIRNSIKLAGAFVAYMIGSGFGTGQEIIQFFTSYGIHGIAGIIISMVLFVLIGSILMGYGYDHRRNPNLNPLKHFTGEFFGSFLTNLIPIYLFLVVVIMLSGAGATMNQYFGTPHIIGTLIMASLVLITNYFGLQKIVDIISYLGQIIVIFTLLISIVAIINKPEGFSFIHSLEEVKDLSMVTSSKGTWWLAGILYVAYNIILGIPFITELGKSSKSKGEAIFGAVIGGVILMATALVLDLALLSHIDKTKGLTVPNLYLSDMISPFVSFMFSLILMGAIFTTASPMLWVSVHHFGGKEGTSRHRWTLVILTIFTLGAGQLPFDKLVGSIYPYTGYLGIIVMVLIISKTLFKKKIIKKLVDK